MQHDGFQRYLPLAGTLAGIALAAGILITRDEPSGDNPTAQTIAGWYGSHGTATLVAGLVCAPLFALFLLFFSASLRGLLRSGEAQESTYSTVVAGAAPLLAFAILLMSSIDMAISAAADKGHADIAQSIYFAGQFSWLPWGAPSAALLLATGLGGMRTATLPRLHGWLSVGLGVIAISPVGFVSFLALPVWLIGTGIVMFRRQSAAMRSDRVMSPALS
jgi:hypothetical protein